MIAGHSADMKLFSADQRDALPVQIDLSFTRARGDIGQPCGDTHCGNFPFEGARHAPPLKYR
jgi:hypothetical protein